MAREGEKKVRKNHLKKFLAGGAVLLLLSGLTTASNAADITNNTEAYKTKEEFTAASKTTTEVLVGGIPFGVRFYNEGITIIGFSEVETDAGNLSPAYSAGLRENDIIMSINSIPVGRAEDFIKTIESCEGKALAIDYKRSGKIFSTSLSPVISKSDGKYKTGMWIKDCTSGIGTVTYVIPETKAFAGLGHSICDTSTGEILKMSGGYVTDVEITGVKASTAGMPGELKGAFTGEKTGIVKENTDVGVFGIFTQMPKGSENCSVMPIAEKSEVKTGSAVIRCTLDGEGIQEYDISIIEVDLEEQENKNYVIEVTDPSLLEKTGGIVQGMSGSPIIQNGKLVGAVTHVLISDPKKGFGIYIGNMTEKMPEIMS